MQEIKKELLQKLISQMKAMMAEGHADEAIDPSEALEDCAEAEGEEEESSVVMEEMFPKKKPSPSPSKPTLSMSAVKQLLMKKPLEGPVKEVVKVSVTPKLQYKK